MLPLFLLRPPSGFGVIETTGRKTGKTRRKCVRAIRRGNKVYLVQLRGHFVGHYLSACVLMYRSTGDEFA